MDFRSRYLCLESVGFVRVTEFSVLRGDSFSSDYSPIAITMSMPSTDIETLQFSNEVAVRSEESHNKRYA